MNDQDISFNIIFKYIINNIKIFTIFFILLFAILSIFKNYIIDTQKSNINHIKNFTIYPITSIEEAYFNEYNTIIYEVSRINTANIKVFEKIIFDFKSSWITDETTIQLLEPGSLKFFRFITRETLLENFYEYLIHPDKLQLDKNLMDFLKIWQSSFEIKESKNIHRINISIPISIDNTSNIENNVKEIIDVIGKQVNKDIIKRTLNFLDINKKRLERSEKISKYYFKERNIELENSEMLEKISSFNDINKKLLNLFIKEVEISQKNDFRNVVTYNNQISQINIENQLEKYYLLFQILFSIVGTILLSLTFIFIKNYIFK